VCAPYDFQPEADFPQFLAFLQEILEHDQERVALLQQWFGYLLVGDTSLQKFLILVGEGANGKTVIDALARTLDRVAADSARPVLSWFVCELGRVMACGMPQPPGTFDCASRRAFFERSAHARWPIQSDSGDPA
jgi:hypothetical protein